VNFFLKIFFVVFCLLRGASSIAQTVDFNFSTTNNLFCNPQAVTFTQNCTGNPDGFIWDFGNGNIGSNLSENITYLLPGTYTVTLTATFTNAAISVSKTIIINPTPTISLSVNKNYICQPGNITFTALASPSIISFEWNFGDGSPVQTSASNVNIHNYTTYNNFNATVKGITAAGCTANTSINVSVKKFPIIATVNPNQGCIPTISTLIASATLPIGDVANNFVWTFGDGSANGNTIIGNTTHPYINTNNISTASVFITTNQGCTNQYNFPTFAFGIPPINTNAITVALRDTFCGSETIQFKGKADSANLYEWDFGDGTSQVTTDTLISHKYALLGNKVIVVKPYFNGCLGLVDTIKIFVTGVIANYTFSNLCSTKNIFNYLNTSLGSISHFEWSYNDFPIFKDSVNYNATHTFPTNGSYTTKLYVYDATTGCSDSLLSYQYTATPTLIYSKPKVCKDSLINYTVTNTYASGSGFNYEFNVNGVVVNNGASPILNYTPSTFGIFNDFVVIKNPAANTCNDTVPLNTTTTVRGPVVNFTTLIQQCSVNSFPIVNNSFPFFATDSITKWQWSFGDNTKDSIRNTLPHKYNTGGNYTITLKATDTNNCAQTFSKLVSVFSMPRIKVFPAMDTLCLGQSANLFAFTVDTLLWTPTTNISCTTCDTVLVNPNFTTLYIAQAKNSAGCISYDTSIVKVYRPFIVNINPVDTFVCPKQIVPLKTDIVGITTWSPSTFLSATNIPNPTSTPDSTITYNVIVADSVGCYADTSLVTVHTFNKPTVNAGPDLTIPYNNPFTINATYSNNIANYAWSPMSNSLSCSNCATPSGIGVLTDTYSIDITSTDGCKASDTVIVYVACDKANLYVPTAFTPNGDGINDYFGPITRGYKLINKLIVYNRWGQKIFEKSNFTPNIPTLGWNGLYNNIPLETQAYIWYVEATCDLGEKISAKGTVVLMK
jgi:gliding motility-associated-like protein